MGWSFRIARIAGIEIKVHVTFFLILIWVAYQHAKGALPGSSLAEGIFFVLTIFACVVLHELGHALAARRYGVRTRDIILLPIGGVARLERIPEKPSQELVVAAAGPLVNVVIVALLGAALTFTHSWSPFAQWAETGGGFFERLLLVNTFLVVFNLIPAFPMDGGRILRAGLALFLPYVQATNIAARLGQALAFLFGFLGLFFNPFLLFIALFVFIGAGQEASQTQMKQTFSAVPVKNVMLTDFYTLTPQDPLRHAIDLTMQGSQRDFPVVVGSMPVGILTQTALLRALTEFGPNHLTGSVMDTIFAVAHPREMVEPVLERLNRATHRTVPVVEADHLLGLITLDNISEFLAIRKALERPAKS